MKNILLLTLGFGLLTGCARTYDITLTNGMRITSKGKPKLDKEGGAFVFQNARGETEMINAARVVEVAPHSSSSSKAAYGQ